MRSASQDMPATYRAALPIGGEQYFDAYAQIYADALHALYAERRKETYDANKAKRDFQKQYGINARQFNSLRVDLDSKEAATEAAHKLYIKALEASVKGCGNALKEIEKELQRSKNRKVSKEKLLLKLHCKKRRLANQKSKLEKAKKVGPRLCFGSRLLFEKQFNLEVNGYRNHEEWLRDWRQARTNSFILLGTCTETAGNVNAQLSRQPDGTYDLKIRVAPGLVKQFCAVILMQGIVFNWGRSSINHAVEDISYAQNNRKPVTVRFCRDRTKWSIHVTVTRRPIKIVTSRNNGRVGVDINNGSLDAALVDAAGNIKAVLSIPYRTSKNANHNQACTSIAEAAKVVVSFAKQNKVPLVHELLNFDSKKQAMRDNNVRNRSMLSSFAYSNIIAALESRAQREGVGILEVNPAYSSLIGCVKFQSIYGLNSGTAAGLVLARRSQWFSERCPLSVTCTPGSPVDGSGHVWKRWAALARNIKLKAKEHTFIRRHDWFRSSGALSPAEVKLLGPAGLISNSTSTSRENRGANRQQHCSVDVALPGVVNG